jgi:primosomal protein N' (replication factor Y)
MQQNPPLIRLAIPTPLRRLFDYLPPAGCDAQGLQPGVRVRVPFGRGSAIGILHSVPQETEVPAAKLRRAQEVIDPVPVLPQALLRLLLWAADYYHHPIGDVLMNALPVWLREGRPAEVRGIEAWSLTPRGHEADEAALRRAPKQLALMELLTAEPLTASQLNEQMDNWRDAMRRLEEKGWAVRQERPCLVPAEPAEAQPAPTLNEGQARWRPW